MKELSAGRLVVVWQPASWRMLRGFGGWHGTNKPFTFVLKSVRSIPFNTKLWCWWICESFHSPNYSTSTTWYLLGPNTLQTRPLGLNWTVYRLVWRLGLLATETMSISELKPSVCLGTGLNFFQLLNFHKPHHFQQPSDLRKFSAWLHPELLVSHVKYPPLVPSFRKSSPSPDPWAVEGGWIPHRPHIDDWASSPKKHTTCITDEKQLTKAASIVACVTLGECNNLMALLTPHPWRKKRHEILPLKIISQGYAPLDFWNCNPKMMIYFW